MKGPRVRIAWVMALIAIVALEFGAIRVIFRFQSANIALMRAVPMLGLGCLPMANFLAIALLIAYRRPGTRPFVTGFATFGAMATAVYSAAVSLYTNELFVPFSQMVITPIVDIFRDGPLITTTTELIVCSILASLLTLPQLAMAAIGGFLTSRRSRLGLMVVLSGPLVGASVGSLGIASGVVHPADLGFYSVLGAIHGLFIGITLAIVSSFYPRHFGDETVISR
jgi:hypothetical protein